ncbi:MAG TPA: glycosyltransferase family 9 protein [Acidobacteriota bacterium]|nr:glycosyltransferase family 9 protein [Acidobacteriota bacterium]
MNLSAARRLDRWIGIPACALLSLFHWLARFAPRRRSDDLGSILLIQISEMGSVLLAYPMLCEIRRRYSESRVSILIFAKNRDSLELLGRIAPDNIILLDDRGVLGFLRSALSAVVSMRRLGIDAVIDLELFSRSSAILAALSGARIRAGFHRHSMEGLYRGSFWTHPVLYNPYQHMSRNFASLVEALQGDSNRPLVKSGFEEAKPILPSPPQDEARKARMADVLAQACGRLGTESKIVLLNPSGGALPIRAWPLENYIELSRRLLRLKEIALGVIGLLEDARFYSRIAEGVDSARLFDLTGKTSHVLDLVELFDLCDVLVTADGGPAHFASVSSIHSVIFFGPETPALYEPLGGNHTCLYAGIACSPCLTAYNHRRTPCDGDNVCVQRFSPAQVEQIVLDKLGMTA